MKYIGALIVLFVQLSNYAQKESYFRSLDEVETTLIQERTVSAQPINILQLNALDYEGVIIRGINEARKRKAGKALVQDEVFNQLCTVGIKTFPNSYFRKGKYFYRITRHTDLGIKYLKGENRSYTVFAMNIDLTDLKGNDRFYFVRGDETTDLRLFKGKRPKTMNPSHPDYKEVTPVKALTEQEFVENVINSIRRKNGLDALLSRYNSHIGVKLRLDEYTVNRKKHPKAFIMLIVGGKQMQRVREREIPTLRSEDDNSLYNLLK